MNRRDLFKAFGLGAAGLLLPKAVLAEPEKRFWSLDRTMIKTSTPATFWIDSTSGQVEQISSQFILYADIKVSPNGLWQTVRLTPGETIDINGMKFGFEFNEDTSDIQYGIRKQDGSISGVRQRRNGMNYDYPEGLESSIIRDNLWETPAWGVTPDDPFKRAAKLMGIT